MRFSSISTTDLYAAGDEVGASCSRNSTDPALIPLPDEPYQYAEWKRCRVNLDYHVEIAKHYYSVPFNLVHQEVEARITARTVEIFLRGKRVASHLRSTLPHRPTTDPRAYAELAPPLSRLDP